MAVRGHLLVGDAGAFLVREPVWLHPALNSSAGKTLASGVQPNSLK
jgi:hypothetical protein